jgi:DNA-binding CsgD family transcriptional regulator
MVNLTNEDTALWVAAITTQPSNPAELMPWIESRLKEFFPFKRLFLAHGELVAGQIKTTYWLTSGYEKEYLRQLAMTFEIEHRGSLKWWFANRQPFYIDPKNPPAYATAFEVDEIKNHGLVNIAAHGVLNIRASAGTYFSFSGVKEPLSNWHLDALRILAPVLNDLFLSYMAAQPLLNQPQMGALTARQKDIVRLVATGLDDKTVAKNLGLSGKTVRNQLTEIYGQLGIHKRAQLLNLLR